MRNFILGVIATIVLFGLGGLAFALLGYMPTNADATPPQWEMRLAMHSLDASMDRSAPRLSNPLPPTDENLIAGMKIYTMNCSGCHGTLDNKRSPLEHSFYPPAPQIILDPPDDPEWHLFYAITTGVRYTGMPAWKTSLSEEDRWKVTAFLSHLEKLSPAVQEYWKKSFGVSPEAAPMDMGGMDKDKMKMDDKDGKEKEKDKK